MPSRYLETSVYLAALNVSLMPTFKIKEREIIKRINCLTTKPQTESRNFPHVMFDLIRLKSISILVP